MQSEKGWIKLHRRLTTWQWYNDIVTFRLFIHLLLTANHMPIKWREITIPAGSLITSLNHLSKATGLSFKQVRTSLNKLKRSNEVAIKTTNRYSMISIVNWDYYQGEGKQRANEGQTKGKQRATNKNDKNEKKKYNNREKVNFEDIDFPQELLNVSGFEESFRDWYQFRKEIKKPLTPTAIKKQIQQLLRFLAEKQNIIEIIDRSISNGWVGLFPIVENNRKNKEPAEVNNYDDLHKTASPLLKKIREDLHNG